MNRTIAISLGLLSLLTQVHAQVVIEQRDIPVQPGAIMTYYTASDPAVGIEVDLGAAGEARRWDFTAYNFDEITQDTLLDPENAAGRETFPDANRVISSAANELGLNIGGGVQYEVVSDSGWYMLGAGGGGGFGPGFDSLFVLPNPLQILPIPAEYADSWEIAARFEYPFPAPDSLADVIDSVIARVAVGGFSEIDGWGTVVYSGGELPALRQYMQVGGEITFVGVSYIFNRRIEVELPFSYHIEASQTYRWLSPGEGEIARVTSLLGEENPDFDRASNIRVRRVIPELVIPDPSIRFGIVHVGNSGSAQISFENFGEGVGSVSRVEFSGGLESEIEVITQLPMVVQVDSSARLRFLWTPTIEKSLWPETVSIYHNDPNRQNPIVIGLQGATPEFQSVGAVPEIPKEFKLISVSPNPFNSTARASISLPTEGSVNITLIDCMGRIQVSYFSERLAPGYHTFPIVSGDLAAGIYLVRVTSGVREASMKAVLIR